MTKYIFYFSMLLFITGCSSSNQVMDKNSTSNFEQTVFDDFSNSNHQQDYEMLTSYFKSTKQKEQTKVAYRDSIYTLEDFKQNIGFNDVQNLKIVNDSDLIEKDYSLKDCRYLLIAD